mmetsp:Transcript_102220/g.305146  ORF Transcript_102220/g.305146 Transcript_102220/m.305146 type:complete len:574 (-) Transcript_102220:26-1747(-)
MGILSHGRVRVFLVALQSVAYVYLTQLFMGQTRPWCNKDHLTTDCLGPEGKKAVRKNGTDLEVILPSYGQTGTTSVTLALRELGYRAFHADDVSIMSRTLMWDKIDHPGWSEGVTKCRMQALSLEPITDVLPLAVAMSPKAKFIMTWRSYESWRKSTSGSRSKEVRWGMIHVALQKGGRIFPWVETWDSFFGNVREMRQVGDPFPSRFPKLAYIYRTLCNGYAWPQTKVYERGTFKSKAHEESYLGHQNEIRMLVPKHRLLEFDVTRHSWEELDAFLGKDSGRKGTPFPQPRSKNLRTNEVIMEGNFRVIGWVLYLFCVFHALNWVVITTAVRSVLQLLWSSVLATGLVEERLTDGRERLTAALEESPVIAVLDGVEPKDAVPLGRALAEAGVRMLAVPLAMPGAESSLQEMAEALPKGVMLGGSVPIEGDVGAVSSAGGHFVLCPATERWVLWRARWHGLATLSGACTPTEACAALHAGADGVFAMPMEQLPLERIRACRDCLPRDVPLLAPAPSEPEACAELFAAGVQGLVVGGASFLKAGEPHAKVVARVTKLLSACRAAAQPSPPAARS